MLIFTNFTHDGDERTERVGAFLPTRTHLKRKT